MQIENRINILNIYVFSMYLNMNHGFFKVDMGSIPFPAIYPGATPLIDNYRGRQVVSSGVTLTQIPGKWSWMKTLDSDFVLNIFS